MECFVSCCIAKCAGPGNKPREKSSMPEISVAHAHFLHTTCPCDFRASHRVTW